MMYPDLVEIAPALAKTGQTTLTIIESQLVDLYRRYCGEWKKFRPRLSGALVH